MNDNETYKEYSKPQEIEDVLHRFPELDATIMTDLNDRRFHIFLR